MCEGLPCGQGRFGLGITRLFDTLSELVAYFREHSVEPHFPAIRTRLVRGYGTRGALAVFLPAGVCL
jgi:hypothetical protein